MPGTLIDEALAAVPCGPVRAWLAETAAHDRYQASLGIMGAAGAVAAAARGLGLQAVTVHRFPADGRTAFWTFRAPVSWTPTHARLEVRADAGGEPLVLDHAGQPFLVATHSAPTPPGGMWAPLRRPGGESLSGAVVLLDPGVPVTGGVAARLVAEGALGFVTGQPARRDAGGREVSGRVELDGGTPLFGFSVTAGQWRAMAALAARGARVHAGLTVDRTAPMPAVTAVLPADAGSGEAGVGGEEVWLTAHLCHPRPGANDNASGVAALLGTAATLLALERRNGAWGRRDRPIRFVWAPEFVGTAAVLHEHLEAGGGWPAAVLNLDMVGEDQALCGSPFVVERGPEHRPSLLAPLAEHIVGEVFRRTAGGGGSWRAVPFHGFSDHALFAGPWGGCPAVQFTHGPDRFNHSGADTLETVSMAEMRRTIGAAAVLAQCVANGYGPVRERLPGIVAAWGAAEERAAAAVSGPPAWTARLRRHVRAVNRRLARLAAGPRASPARPSLARAPLARGAQAAWTGPVNLRAMIACLPPERRSVLDGLIRADKGVLAVLANLAVRADGRRGRDGILGQAGFALRRPLDPAAGRVLWDVLRESGWVREGGGAGPRRRQDRGKEAGE